MPCLLRHSSALRCRMARRRAAKLAVCVEVLLLLAMSLEIEFEAKDRVKTDWMASVSSGSVMWWMVYVSSEAGGDMMIGYVMGEWPVFSQGNGRPLELNP